MILSAAGIADQNSLKCELQTKRMEAKFEHLAAALLGDLLGVSFIVAKSGFQFGADAGTAGRQGRHLRLECKKYADTTDLDERELLGEIVQALARDQALEAWVLAATRSVPEQLEQSLNQHGEKSGVPIIILAWGKTPKKGMPDIPDYLTSLAALCAYAPDIVASEFSVEAGRLARLLQPASKAAIERLRRDLQAWSLGFDAVRAHSLNMIRGIWQSERTSKAAFGQNAAGGAEKGIVQRKAVHHALDAWWADPAKSDAPMAVIGLDGAGKTWATVNWLVDRLDSHPIVLIVPSSATAELSRCASELAVKQFLAAQLFGLTGVREQEHWLRRLDNLLKRPVEEGPVLTVFFDGINQEPSVPWTQIFMVLQGEAFAGRIRIVLTTRTFHYTDKLARLCSLVVAASVVSIDAYDLATGGELDQMLAFEGLTRNDLPNDLIEHASTPRLFKLVIKLREQLANVKQVTVHRLLWEYGRDSFGIRGAGQSYSECEWRNWLQDIAKHLINAKGATRISSTALRATTGMTDRPAALLGDIVDSRFTVSFRQARLNA